MSLPLFAFVAFALASLILALPRSKGCLAELTRLLALIGGVVAPAVLLRPQLDSVGAWVLLLALIIPATAALALAAVAWQTLIQGTPKDIDGQVDLSIFDPSDWLNTPTSSLSSSASSNELENCLFAIVMMILGALFWVGLQLAGLATRHLMPGPTTFPRRAIRIALSAAYGTAVYTGIVWALVGTQPVPVSNSGAVSARPALRGTALPTLAPVALSALEPRLNALWNALDKGDKITRSQVIWQPAYSPFFPTEWPPTPMTTWVRYAFAYGQDPDIGGGQRVAPPWAFVEVRAGGETASIAPQRGKLEAFDVQGTVSLSREALAALGKGEQVVAYSLSLSAMPAAASSEGADMRAFYRAWFAGNGAIAALIKPAHAGFVAWVEQ